jgi:predicted  nucleic acid-binding Zn-ribbon protein
MYDVWNQRKKRKVRFKCWDCGHRFTSLIAALVRKCPKCGGNNIQLAENTISDDERPFPIVH